MSKYDPAWMHESHCNVQTKHGLGERACRLCKYTVSRLVLCIGSNMGLKFGRERPIRVLSPCFAHPNIRKETNCYKFIPHFV